MQKRESDGMKEERKKKNQFRRNKSVFALLLALLLAWSGWNLTACTELSSAGQKAKTEISASADTDLKQGEDAGQTGGQSADTDLKQGEDAGQTGGQSVDPSVNPSVDLSNGSIPAYDGKAYISIHHNVPSFSDADKKRTDPFESYSDLDQLGRCGVAYANVCKEIMPTEKRGAIGAVRPSGWHTIKYDIVDGKYLYNRCHLIGYQLSGENANAKNLITGTRYLNTEGMLPFENMVADYVKETGHHVLYRVTPIFQDNNLVASGVQMEAWSVEDQGAGICFNVYCYNVQPGITIDYASGASGLNGQPLSNQGARSQSTGDSSSSGGSSGSSSGAVSQQSQAAQQSSQKAAQSTQQASQDTASANSGSERTVYITGSGKHYHLTTSCRGLRQAKSITPISESDAIARGYTLCGFEK